MSLETYGWMILLFLMFTPLLGQLFGPLWLFVYKTMHTVSPAWLSAYSSTFHF